MNMLFRLLNIAWSVLRPALLYHQSPAAHFPYLHMLGFPDIVLQTLGTGRGAHDQVGMLGEGEKLKILSLLLFPGLGVKRTWAKKIWQFQPGTKWEVRGQ